MGQIAEEHRFMGSIFAMRISPPILAALCLVWAMPALIFTYLQLNDVFFWFPLSGVARGLFSGQMLITEPDQPAYEAILFALASVTGLTPLQLSYLPIGAVFIPLCYFTAARALTRSDVFAALLGTYAAFDFAIAQMGWSTFMYTWTHALFLGFLFSYWAYVQRAGIAFLAMLSLFFLATYLLHPTYTFWMILIAALTSLFTFRSNSGSSRAPVISTLHLATGMIVLYFGFNQLFYRVFVKRLVVFESDEVLDLFLPIIRQFLGLEAALQAPFSVAASPPTALVGLAAFARTGLLLSIIVVLAVMWLRRDGLRVLIRSWSARQLMILVLVMVGAGHTAAYAIYGHMSFRYVILVYPFVFVLLAMEMNVRRSRVAGLLGLMIFLGASATLSFAAEKVLEPSNVIYDEIQGSARFLMDVGISADDRVLSDFETAQILTYAFAENGRTFNRELYTSEQYAEVLGNASTSKSGFEYLLINQRLGAEPVTSSGWRFYEPLGAHSATIAANMALQRIYDDGHVIALANVR